MSAAPPEPASATSDSDRRTAVLLSALRTFGRYGYRKTSMEQVARDANISRPGLYFLFATKESLFREAVEQSLQHDLAVVERELAEPDSTLGQRLLGAFDQWAAKYVGPLTRDVQAVVDDNPDLLGPVARAAPARFAAMISDAISLHVGPELGEPVAQTLLSTSVGIKYQVDDRQEYLKRLEVALAVLLRPGLD